MSLSFIVNESYPCLQGEGANLGKPSMLVRFQICNLRCTWCDTSYTHTYKSDPISAADPTGPQHFKRYTLGELVALIREQTSSLGIKHLIFTGGEPTLQNFMLLLKEKELEGYSCEVETNGTIIPHNKFKDFLYNDYRLAQWNVSPKFSNAGEEIDRDALAHWSALARGYDRVFFKFVARKDHAQEDFSAIKNLIEEFSIPKRQVFLMPEGVTVASQISNQWLHDFCLQEGFHYTPRLHVLLFGDVRGV